MLNAKLKTTTFYYSQTGCSFPRNIATLLGILQFWLRDCSEQVATDVIKLQVEIHNQICKQSLWLATSNKEEPIKYSEQMDWFFFATSSQSETLFTNLIVNFNLQFDHVSCNLLRAISQSKLQYSQQCCTIPRKRTSGLTVKKYFDSQKEIKFLIRKCQNSARKLQFAIC
jgi:hypothetical protein